MAHSAATQALAQLLESAATALHLAGFKDGLQPVHWVALRYFDRCNPSAATVIQFSNHHGTTRGTASKTISLLVAKGLLVREDDEEDRRRHFLRVTGQGRDILAHDPLGPVIATLDDLPDADRLGLARSLEKVIRTLRRG